VNKFRLTGSEPLVRRGAMSLFQLLSRRLRREACERVARFAAISRRGQLSDVLSGIEAADRAGLKVKIDAVAQK
jgi:cyclic pyranopterin phosphate synthase